LVECTHREFEFRRFSEKDLDGAIKESSPDDRVSPSAAEVDSQVEKKPKTTSVTSIVSGSVLDSITLVNLAWLTDED
jgi:hypothetical protein